MTTGQGVAYKKCLESFGGRHTVMGFFDMDEFLVLLDPNNSIAYSTDCTTQGFTSNLERFMTTGQGVAYKKCLESFGGRHTVMGFFDVDESFV
jgi:hypothetical protein